MGFLSTTGAIILSLFPAEEEPNPVTAFVKIVVMTAVLLLAGLAVYRRGQRSIAALHERLAL
jgi:multisubunit Na+/H+ antiporter MnhB subunit